MIKIFFYERRVYESVDNGSLFYVGISQEPTKKKELMQQRVNCFVKNLLIFSLNPTPATNAENK